MDPSTRPTERRPLRAEEQRLLRRFRDGDDGAFHDLLRPHLAALLALARRHTGDPHWAEDLVQETLVRACRGLESFRGESSLRTWLYRILVRLAAEPDRWRRQDRAAELCELVVPDHLDLPEDGALTRELRERLAEATERLTPRQRCALHLRAVEGLDYAAIADVLECSPGAARMLVLAARRNVMDRIGEYLEP